MYQAGPNGGSYVFSLSGTVSFTNMMSGTTTLTAEVISTNFQIQSAKSYTSQATGTITFNLTPNDYNWVYEEVMYEHREGTADAYGPPGYEGPGTWHIASALHDQNPIPSSDIVTGLGYSTSVPTY